MTTRLIIGLGTGRCGTQSLARLLAAQKNTLATHERTPYLPWQPRGRGEVFDRCERILWEAPEDGFGCDVALFYLPYVPIILDRFPDARFVCLRRNKTQTVRSYCRKFLYDFGWRRDYLRGKGVPSEAWNACYPKYDGITSTREAVGRFWEDYYKAAREYQEAAPESFRVFPMTDLLWPTEILDFCGFADPEYKVFHVNRSPDFGRHQPDRQDLPAPAVS